MGFDQCQLTFTDITYTTGMRTWLIIFTCLSLATACKQQPTGRKDTTSTEQAQARSAPAPQRKDKLAAVTDEKLGLCSGSITHTERVHITPVGKPPFMAYYKDPAFGTKVIRISNSRKAEATKPAYSTMQAWNADESLLMLYRTGHGTNDHVLYDGNTYERLGPLDIWPVDIEEVWWSRTDPASLFYVSGEEGQKGHFLRYNLANNTKTLIKDFSKVCGANAIPTGGGDVFMQSEDDDLFAFRCDNEQKSQTMFTYRLSTDEIVTAELGGKTRWNTSTAPAASASGERLWLQGYSLKTDLKTVEQAMDLANSENHSSIGRTHDGQDAIYQVVFNRSPGGCDGDLWNGVGHIVQHNLETGACRPLVGETQGYPYTTSSTHVSALSTKHPGWVAGSSIGKEFDWFGNGRKAPALFSEIYLANSDPDNPVVCRLAHHRSYGKQATNEGYAPYFSEPHATISPSGTRIIFGSDWYDSGSVDTYVIELPMHKRP